MTRFKNKVQPGSVFLAPMEGVTNDAYRRTIFEEFGGWDVYACDFLRIPSQGYFPRRILKDHIGDYTLTTPELKKRTYLQVLASEKSNIEGTLKDLEEFELEWLDLNLCCPSKKVNGHKGGAYLLENLKGMETIIRRIRNNFDGLLSVKIRIGYKDDKNFESIIKILENEGVEGIAIHARTKEQMYKGPAKWNYIQRAVELTNVPIIGNGDIVRPIDIPKMINETGCYAVMVGRGALQTPWLASLYKKHRNHLKEISNDHDFLETIKVPAMKRYFKMLQTNTEANEEQLLKRFKGLSKYLVEDLSEKETLRPALLRSQSFEHFSSLVQAL